MSKSTVNFADVAHQTLIFDPNKESNELILKLIDTKWVQRLRQIRQTGNTYLVYMFAEHSRFGHSLGVAYLASILMDKLAREFPERIVNYRNAVATAALLHDIGHVAPGSHLAEKVWEKSTVGKHESVSIRVIKEDQEIKSILSSYPVDLVNDTAKILSYDKSLPPWTTSIISGDGWNADRGNWAIVDSAMCSVSYGRYNVSALIDAFTLSENNELVIRENRLDALTHFFVARDSMYRQVYQHRALQAVDSLVQSIVQRLRDILADNTADAKNILKEKNIFCDKTMYQVLVAENYVTDLELEDIFKMTESWWNYHIEHWTSSADCILADLSSRLRDRKLFKTMHLEKKINEEERQRFLAQTKQVAEELGFDPKYYVQYIDNKDKHRKSAEVPPLVKLDSGEIISAAEIEPMIAQFLTQSKNSKTWLAVPEEVKSKLGRLR